MPTIGWLGWLRSIRPSVLPSVRPDLHFGIHNRFAYTEYPQQPYSVIYNSFVYTEYTPSADVTITIHFIAADWSPMHEAFHNLDIVIPS